MQDLCLHPPLCFFPPVSRFYRMVLPGGGLKVKAISLRAAAGGMTAALRDEF